MMDRMKLLVTCLITSLCIMRCGDSDKPTEVSGGDAAGIYTISELGVSMSVDLKTGNTFEFRTMVTDESDIDYVMARSSGTYIIDGTVVTFTGTECEAMGFTTECEEPFTGTLSGNTLTMTSEDGDVVLTKQ